MKIIQSRSFKRKVKKLGTQDKRVLDKQVMKIAKTTIEIPREHRINVLGIKIRIKSIYDRESYNLLELLFLDMLLNTIQGRIITSQYSTGFSVMIKNNNNFF